MTTDNTTGTVETTTFKAATQDDFCYLIPKEKFIFRKTGVWQLDSPVGKEGIAAYLSSRGWEDDIINSCLKGRNYMKVTEVGFFPSRPPIFMDKERNTFINTYVAPTLQPVSGAYPRLESVLNHLTGNDPSGVIWLKNWIALKVQNPELVPKVATLFCTAPGAGKGSLARVIQEMLGPDNCASIDRAALENKFNSRWVGKLFVLADEVVNSDNARDIAERLKILIDSNVIEHEGKGKDQKAVQNYAAWMFASNDKIAPIKITEGDRRYTVFTNHSDVTPEYKKNLDTMFEADRKTWTPEMIVELQAFFHDMQTLEVDRALVSRPYENESRKQLLLANMSVQDQFFAHVDASNIDTLLDKVLTQGNDFSLSRTRSQWDFPERGGLSNAVIYACYQEFCKSMGAKPMMLNKFGAACQNKTGIQWESKLFTAPGGSRVPGRIVPRKAKTENKGQVIPMRTA